MVGALSEFERGLTAERVKDGLAYVKRRGTRSGRLWDVPDSKPDLMTICDAPTGRTGEKGTISEVAKQFGVSRACTVTWPSESPGLLWMNT